MPRIFRLALAQINPTVGDIRGNCEKIQQYLDEARRLGADLVAFPEMAVTGYPPEDLLLKKAFVEENMAATRRLAESSHGTAIVVGYVHQGERTTNAAAVACDGVLVDTYHKIYLPNYGVFDEERYFTPGSVCPVYEIDGARIGVNVCEDIWYDSGPTSVQRENGAELIVNINASPFHTGKSESRRSMIASRAADNRLFVAYLNTVGGQDELVFDGNSIICGPDGETVARGPAFRETLIVADLDLDQVDRSSLRRPTWESHEILAGIGSSKTVHVSGYRTKERPALAPPLQRLRRSGRHGRGGRGLPCPGCRHAGLPGQNRLPTSHGGVVRRHRFGAHGHSGGRRPGGRERPRHHHALPFFLRRQHRRL